MDILFLLLPLALLLGVVGLAMMIWALRNGQFEDLEGAAQRILYDDDQELIPTHPAPDHKQPEGSGKERR
ncbi:MAG: cbb3-type cytochrome oxidase assembly protein CcoS [Magnetococcales bacterium]|nr:cbb3-type cytochrome oxidase assembly protein CcoS [Magnetococcales bacterium]MBF0321373.1 cbb3-type cytochrome oxidase assembly protein CcoS [Magnetococcales bacterium]